MPSGIDRDIAELENVFIKYNFDLVSPVNLTEPDKIIYVIFLVNVAIKSISRGEIPFQEVREAMMFGLQSSYVKTEGA